MRTCFGVGEPRDPQFTISAAHSHAVCYAIDQQGGKGGANYAKDVMPSLCSDSHGTPHGVCYVIDALSSNSMKSKNPNSGFHEEDRTKCLDTSCLNPTCNQGGVVIVESLQRTGKRPYGDETE